MHFSYTCYNAVKRLQVLQRILSISRTTQYGFANISKSSNISSDASKVTLGNISKTLKAPQNEQNVPHMYIKRNPSQTWLKHLKWMLQKDLLGQDIFLIGPPGPLKRCLALSYLELTRREAEFITLTRDTTDSDLKQRREIKGGTSYYHDQSAVRAATEGRVLVLEGVEKAERNVLPVLNNLLENREMQLEDGRLLIPSFRYDKLLQRHSKEELDGMKLVRVNEDFRVIALGLPSPPYLGHPLDPPLRSRFQARDVSNAPFRHHFEELMEEFPEISSDLISKCLSLSHTLCSEESRTLGLPDFPVDGVKNVLKMVSGFPESRIDALLSRLYPAPLFLPKEGQKSATDAFASFNFQPFQESDDGRSSIAEVSISSSGQSRAVVKLRQNDVFSSAEVVSGGNLSQETSSKFVSVPYHESLLVDLLTSHSVADFCLVGPRGCGKSEVVKRLAGTLGYQVEPILLYQDMTARDLVQQRATNADGDTFWQLSPLILAALTGKMAVLDGLHRLHHGTLAVLHRLVHDREIQLYDGRRLLRQDRFDAIKENLGCSEEEMNNLGVYCIHPSFRIVGLAEPPRIGDSKGQWMTSETLSLFLYHSMRTLNPKETRDLVSQKIGSCSPEVQELITLTDRLLKSTDPALKSISQSLSLRQILRIARRFHAYTNFDLHSAVYKACLARFLPPVVKDALDKELSNSGLAQLKSPFSEEASCEVMGDSVRIGQTHAPRYSGEVASKVPDTLFFDINQHIHVLESMLQDWLLGDHLLLIGNQGVGKNKLADRFLQLLNRPREYIQLHRDTTVQSLTLQPSVEDGRIKHQDSPLVVAVKGGHVLVVDEADKAPTHVTCVLKTLVETGEMLLSDGRRIVPFESAKYRTTDDQSKLIVAHPDFRMIVLANRPGFPFLGNDFFGSLGDLFSCHAIDNPSVEAEMSLLQEYGPDVSTAVMKQLVVAFGELRDLADKGLIQYPYSTREVVNIVKHLQEYREDGIGSVVRNVLDFDTWSGEARETVMKVMHKHGIPVGASASNVNLAKRLRLPDPVVASSWSVRRREPGVEEISFERSNISFKGPISIDVIEENLDPLHRRSLTFTEQESYWSLPFYETSFLSGITTSTTSEGNPAIHVVTTSPFALYSLTPKPGLTSIRHVLLHDISLHRSSRSSRMNIASMPKDLLAVHDETSHSLLVADLKSNKLWSVQLTSFLESARASLKQTFQRGSEEAMFKMDKTFCKDGSVLFWESGGNRLQLVDIPSKACYSCNLPLCLNSCTPLTKDHYLLTDKDLNKYILKGSGEIPNVLYPITENDLEKYDRSPISQVHSPLEMSILSSALGKNISAPSSLLALPNEYAAIAVGFPELAYSENEIHVWQRDTQAALPQYRFVDSANFVAVLPEAGQVIRILEKIPKNALNEVESNQNCSYLEIVDLSTQSLSYLPIPRPNVSSMWNFLVRDYASLMMVAPFGKDGVVTVDSFGGVRLWDTSGVGLERALYSWKRMVGNDEAPVRLEIEKESGKDVTEPKHGKVDPTGNPHVGGNTWAGGTGGRDTAGLGGKGGPYRLDAGHDVHQVPDWEKEAVPEEVKKAAREMGQKAFKERLQEIQMSEYDASLYEKFLVNVQPQIKALRNVISTLQARSKERQWLRHRTDGELDDLKLIEGIAGEKNIYRQRREEEPEVGAPMTKPKRLRLVVDVSGSMYRFNGHDGRLEREMEATLMVMEALEGFETKFKYDIIGHSGEEAEEILVKSDKPPANNKERLDVLKTMQAHSQFCLNGDNTLEAARLAIDTINKEDADESFVILLSDANLDRYGIHPRTLNDTLNRDQSVYSYVIFIGSLGNQADRLKQSLPAGKAFVCMDVSQLPQILQQIFTSAMLT